MDLFIKNDYCMLDTLLGSGKKMVGDTNTAPHGADILMAHRQGSVLKRMLPKGSMWILTLLEALQRNRVSCVGIQNRCASLLLESVG